MAGKRGLLKEGPAVRFTGESDCGTAVGAQAAETQLESIFTQVRFVVFSAGTSTAESVRHDNPLAGFHIRNATPDCLYDAGAFVTEHRRQR